MKGLKMDGLVHISMRSPYLDAVGGRKGKTRCGQYYDVKDQDPDNCWLGELVETVVTCVACASMASST